MIFCRNCGEVSKDDIHLFNADLRKQDFDILPILPTCKQCASELAVSHNCCGGNIIVINGTCGSGKSTLAEILAKRDFLAIDGDCVLQVVKHKKNQAQVDFQDSAVFNEVACEIDILSMFSDNLVLSHILMPEDMDKYVEMFNSRNLRYKFFLLRPSYEVAVSRCQTRTCHRSITPEQWIRHFYDTLVFNDDVEVVDNSNMTAEQTVDYILEKCLIMFQR